MSLSPARELPVGAALQASASGARGEEHADPGDSALLSADQGVDHGADHPASEDAVADAVNAGQTPHPPGSDDADPGDGPDDPSSRIKQRAVRGGAWTVVGFGSSQGLRFVNNVVLAQVIARDDFGLMGLVTVVLIGLQLFSDIGIGPAIIQNKRQDARFLNTAWTIQVFRGFALWGAAALLAWPLSVLWADKGGGPLATLLPVVAVSAAISGFLSTNWFTANRQLAVKRMMLIELSAVATQTAVMIGYAYLVEASYWALAAGVPAYALVRVTLSHTLPGVRNKLDWDRTAVRELVRFGKWLFISTVITFFAMRSDALLLQSFAGVATVGVFWVALQVADLGPALASKLGALVGFPALSEVYRTRPADLSKELLRVRKALLLPIYAVLMGMILLGPALFYVLYPASFWNCGWVVQALAFNSLAGQVNTTYGHAYMASGHTFRNMSTVAAQWVLVVTFSTTGFFIAGETGFLLGLATAQFGKYPVDAYLASKTGVWQPRFDLPLLCVGVAVALLMLGGSLLITPYALELNEVIRIGFETLKDTIKGAQG